MEKIITRLSSHSLLCSYQRNFQNHACIRINAKDAEASGLAENNSKPELSDADLLIWLGDFNYRIDHLSYEQVMHCIQNRQWKRLLDCDQLRNEMKKLRTFRSMREAVITFPPTYKFDKSSRSSLGYDSSEKKRIPAWCDRVLFRDGQTDPSHRPDLFSPVKATVIKYDACMGAWGSDHKPVICILDADFAMVDENAKRVSIRKIMNSNSEAIEAIMLHDIIPSASVSTQNIRLGNGQSRLFRINNHNSNDFIFSVACEEMPPGTAKSTYQQISDSSSGPKIEQKQPNFVAFPPWLQVTPASGMVGPDQCATIEIMHGPSGFYSNLASKCNDSSGPTQKMNSIVLVVSIQPVLSSKTIHYRINVNIVHNNVC